MFSKDENGKWGVDYSRILYVEKDYIGYLDKNGVPTKTGYIDPSICDKVAVRFDIHTEFSPNKEVLQILDDLNFIYGGNDDEEN